jgi:hypothetical protein
MSGMNRDISFTDKKVGARVKAGIESTNVWDEKGC